MSGTQTYPRLFGKYAIIAPLARGGMGELHLAVSGEAELKKLCVIKQIIGHLSDREFVRRFLDEAKLVVKLSHQNLVPIFESGVENGQYFLVMEYIEGRDLRAVWNTLQDQERTCPLKVALHVTKEICRGLSYAHTYGELELVHRDISPPNILLSYSGEVRITDFGLASSRLKVQKTAPGVLFGKLAYMAPEQARNEPLDPRTDIYAAGVIFWEFVTGRRLFPRKGTQLEQLQRAANPTIPRPSQVKEGLPAAIDLIASRALAPRRDDRYPTAEAMRRDIAGLLAKIDPTADASSVAHFLQDLYGDRIEEDRQDREALLDRLTPEVRRLREEAKERARGRSSQNLADAAHDVVAEEDDDDLLDEPTGPAPALQPGTILGERYRIESLLREGGMGTVYSATHIGIDKLVAVKVLHPAYSRMPDVVSRFRREARAASKIGHPNIIEIFDSGETSDGAVYFAMEHLIGQDLADLLEDAGALPIDRVLGIVGQICQAVEAAHEAGIIHRDLKPENVFLVPREGQVDFVKVLDFGIAQNTHLDESRKERLTHPGMPMGTPEYMAPEQAAGLGADHRADIYAVGAILYEMLAGKPIHGGDNMLAVLTAKAKGNIPPLREARPDVPQALDEIVTWALAHEPEDRPQSIGHMAYELTKLTSGRAGAVASMLGLSDLAPPPEALNLNTLAPPQGRGAPDAPATSPQEPPPRRRDADSDADSASHRRTAEVILAPPRRQRRWVVGLLIATGIGLGAYLLGRGTADPGPEPLDPGPRHVTAKIPPKNTQGPPPSEPSSQRSSRPSSPPSSRPASTSIASASRPTSLPTQAGSAQTNHASISPRHPPAPSPSRVVHPGRRLLKLGRRHLKKGRFAKATTALKAASHYARFRAAALLGLAEVAFQRGDYQAAARHAAAAHRRGGGWRAELALANYLYRLNRLTAAASGYESVLAKHPDNEEARRGLARTRKLLRRHP